MCVDMTRPTVELEVTCGSCRALIRKDEEDDMKKGIADEKLSHDFEDDITTLTADDAGGEVEDE